jgi:uncharacterized protein YbjT (DUF2867 family)
MRYFVTGATGFLGGHVARLLRVGGHEVVALARKSADGERIDRLRRLGVEIASGDITDRGSLKAAIAGAGATVLVAGSAIYLDPRGPTAALRAFREAVGR